VVDLYDVLCAILYVLKSGCQWRMLPRDFPNWPEAATLRLLSSLYQNFLWPLWGDRSRLG